MNRQRKIDEELWEDGDEQLSSDHVVERFFSQHEHAAGFDAPRKTRPGTRAKRRSALAADSDELQ
jgi:hypothetical protein